jgi:hypothetical protein
MATRTGQLKLKVIMLLRTTQREHFFALNNLHAEKQELCTIEAVQAFLSMDIISGRCRTSMVCCVARSTSRRTSKCKTPEARGRNLISAV